MLKSTKMMKTEYSLSNIMLKRNIIQIVLLTKFSFSINENIIGSDVQKKKTIRY